LSEASLDHWLVTGTMSVVSQLNLNTRTRKKYSYKFGFLSLNTGKLCAVICTALSRPEVKVLLALLKAASASNSSVNMI